MQPSLTQCARRARELVDPEHVRSLKSPRPATVFLSIAAIWVQLIAAWCIALLAPPSFLVIPFAVNCAMIQAMLLWTHEASHFSLLRSRKWNDVLCDALLAGPVGMSVAGYRHRHVSHHAHLGTDQDADGYPYRYPIKGVQALLLVMCKALSGGIGIWLATTKYLGSADQGAASERCSRASFASLVIVNLSLLAMCVAMGRWYVYLVVWVYPIFAVAIVLNIIRTIAEHQPDDYPCFVDGEEVAMRPVARTTIPGLFEKWLMYQANFNFHVEHHLYPAIPQHNLSLLHRHLAERGFYREFPDALQSSGFGRFWRLIVNRRRGDFTDSLEDALQSS